MWATPKQLAFFVVIGAVGGWGWLIASAVKWFMVGS